MTLVMKWLQWIKAKKKNQKRLVCHGMVLTEITPTMNCLVCLCSENFLESRMTSRLAHPPLF